ncbi:hypothetical protein [Bacillus infantis]|uniref:Uncharacterized protein n=1 Tax=Bacillus infantis TaxID=324767 RepID=A0A5D4R8C7_9BACI|nr:hypothetical protein [Bacillus infantis]TYS46779.1 hypothetical protein FZD51_15010 [Bacillus infantis]
MEWVLDLDGRTLVESEALEMKPERVVSVSKYDDGTWIKFIHEAGKVRMESNKTLELQADGRTLKIQG